MRQIHHIAASTANQQAVHQFYTEVLGLHSIPSSPGSQNQQAATLQYATTSPSSPILYVQYSPHLPTKQLGTDTISAYMLSVSAESSLQYWQHRLAQFHLWHSPIETVKGRQQLRLEDPEGQSIILISRPHPSHLQKISTQSPIPSSHAIQGLAGVCLTVPTLEHLHFMFTKVFGWSTADNVAQHNQTYGSITTYAIGPSESSPTIDVVLDDRLDPIWQQQAGSIQSMAIEVGDRTQLQNWQTKLSRFGLPVTSPVNHQVYYSISLPLSPGIRLQLVAQI